MFKRENMPNWVCAALCAYQVIQQNIWRREDLKQPFPDAHELQFWISNVLLVAALVFSALRRNLWKCPIGGDFRTSRGPAISRVHRPNWQMPVVAEDLVETRGSSGLEPTFRRDWNGAQISWSP